MIALGGLFIWAAITGRAKAVIDAFPMSLPDSIDFSPGGQFGGSTGAIDLGGGSSSDNVDSGSHAAVDAQGNPYTINKPYGSMTPAEKDDANRAAHLISGS